MVHVQHLQEHNDHGALTEDRRHSRALGNVEAAIVHLWAEYTSNDCGRARANAAVQAACMRSLLPSAVQRQWPLRCCDVLRKTGDNELLVSSGGTR
jgi:hypothetical protein